MLQPYIESATSLSDSLSDFSLLFLMIEVGIL